jgi:hypothetical protein
MKIYKGVVLTILLHGCESWPLTEAQTAKLDAFHHRQLRAILKIPWWLIRNDEVLQRAKISSIGDKVRQLRMFWLGHVIRMDQTRLPSQALFGQLSGRRRSTADVKM